MSPGTKYGALLQENDIEHERQHKLDAALGLMKCYIRAVENTPYDVRSNKIITPSSDSHLFRGNEIYEHEEQCLLD